MNTRPFCEMCQVQLVDLNASISCELTPEELF